MGIQNISTFFKQLQKELGVSRQEFSKNVCSERAIYAIEQGVEGIHIDLFQDIMAKYGLPCTYLPAFRDKEEFTAFRDLTDAMYYIKCWNLSRAYPLLLFLQSRQYANSQMIYRRTQLAKLLLMLRSGTANDAAVFEIAKSLFEGTSITPENFEEHFPSAIEYRMLITYSECLLHQKKTQDSLLLMQRIISNLSASNLPQNEKSELLSKGELVLAQVLFAYGRFEEAEKVSASGIEKCLYNVNHDALPELICWNALAHDRLGNRALAKQKLEDICSFLIVNHKRLAGRIYQIVKENHPTPKKLLTEMQTPPPDMFFFPREDAALVKALSTQKPPVSCSYQLGDIIHDLRVQQDMTQKELAGGLCDRSQLSKIESGQLYPGRLLSQSLLERLGLRANNFTFFTSKREFDFAELKYQYGLYNIHNEYDKLEDQKEKFYTDEEKTNRLIRQAYLLHCSFAAPSNEERLEQLKEGLDYTFRGSWDTVYKHKGLTFAEATFFNKILQTYNSMGEYEKARALAVQLVNFHSQKTYEPDARWRVFEIVTYQYIYALFNLKDYAEIESIMNGLSKDLPLNDISNLGFMYYFSSQMLAEQRRSKEEIRLHTKAALAALRILGNEAEAARYCEGMSEKYGITV